MLAPIVWLILLFVLAGCATARTGSAPAPAAPSRPRAALPPSKPRPPALRPGAFEQIGEASWYGRQHHGKPTASGETYDMSEFTAAHPTLPFGTRVRVTNLDNGRRVEVRINDRGPFVAGRVLDLSHAAALKLGAVADGLIPVRLKVIEGESAGN